MLCLLIRPLDLAEESPEIRSTQSYTIEVDLGVPLL